MLKGLEMREAIRFKPFLAAPDGAFRANSARGITQVNPGPGVWKFQELFRHGVRREEGKAGRLTYDRGRLTTASIPLCPACPL
jgi:hypothetical protein